MHVGKNSKQLFLNWQDIGRVVLVICSSDNNIHQQYCLHILCEEALETICDEAREVCLRAILTRDYSIIVALDATELEIGKTQR